LNDDFAFFRHGEARDFRAKNWPERALIDRLNQQFPGEPVAFFSCGDTAGLHGIAYADNWHSSEFLDRLKAANTSGEIAAIMRSLGIRHIIAPVDMRSVVPLRETFLRQWAGPTGIMSGPLELFDLRSEPVVIPRELPALPAGAWEDIDARIEYTGAWIHDPQFAQATGHSVTYSYAAGDKAALAFAGSGITYVFTKAVNRGVAAVVIDGTEVARIDQYSRATAWSSRQTFDALSAGTHSFEVRVTGEKNPRSSGTYVDLDQIIVIP
jgi:hypothetical protein